MGLRVLGVVEFPVFLGLGSVGLGVAGVWFEGCRV